MTRESEVDLSPSPLLIPLPPCAMPAPPFASVLLLCTPFFSRIFPPRGSSSHRNPDDGFPLAVFAQPVLDCSLSAPVA